LPVCLSTSIREWASPQETKRFPFFISKIQQNSETLFTLHFKGLSNPEEAQKLVNRSVLLPKNLIKTVEQEASLEDYLVGFMVEDNVIV
jgi:hypothetical protein